MTAPLPADFPIRPGFWNVPLWGEIGVYVAAVITIALCAWGEHRMHAAGRSLAHFFFKDSLFEQAIPATGIAR